MGSLLSGYDVVVCTQCGFCFADHIPQQAIFDTYYREMSKYEHLDNMGKVSKYDFARFELAASIIEKSFSKRQARIMEIGCSTGTLLSILKKDGYENILGVDPSPACAEVAQRLYGIPVVTNTLSAIEIRDKSIDALILMGVIEHIHDLKNALSRCWNMLADDGRIYIGVPDASRYFEGEDAPFQEFSVEHINFFGPDSLTNLMKINGFAMVSIEQGLIEANYRTTTPVIHGVYKKNLINSQSPVSPDAKTEKGLRLYIEQSRQRDGRVQKAIAKVVSARKPIIVWGTGAHTLRLLATSKLGEAKIRAFVDSNPSYQGKLLNNIPIVAPQALKEWLDPILISSRVYQKEIAEQIRTDLQLNNEIIQLY